MNLLKDPEVRETAAVALRTTHDPSAAEPLMDAVRNGAVEAVTTLGLLHDPRAIQVLVEALPRAGHPARRALDENYPGWRQSEQARAATPALIAAWAEGPRQQRLEAADWLAAVGDRRAIEPLIGSLTAGLDYDLLPAALRALDAIDPDWVRHEDAAKAIPVLAEAALENPPCGWSKAALNKIALARPQAMAEALRDGRYCVRHAAAAALKETLPADAVRPLAAVLSDPNAAELAAGVFRSLMSSALSRILTEDLRAIAKLCDVPGIRWHLNYSCQVLTGDTGTPVEVNLAHARQIARMELKRRGEYV